MSLLLENPRENVFFFHYFPERFCTGDGCVLGTVVSLAALFYTGVKSQTNWGWKAPLDIVGSVSLLVVSRFFSYSIPSTVIKGLTEFASLSRVMWGLRKRETMQDTTCPLKQSKLCIYKMIWPWLFPGSKKLSLYISNTRYGWKGKLKYRVAESGLCILSSPTS